MRSVTCFTGQFQSVCGTGLTRTQVTDSDPCEWPGHGVLTAPNCGMSRPRMARSGSPVLTRGDAPVVANVLLMLTVGGKLSELVTNSDGLPTPKETAY